MRRVRLLQPTELLNFNLQKRNRCSPPPGFNYGYSTSEFIVNERESADFYFVFYRYACRGESLRLSCCCLASPAFFLRRTNCRH